MHLKKNANQTFNNSHVFHKKSGRRLLIGDTRWRTREEAVAATAGPKRREPMAPGARQIRKAKGASISSKGCPRPSGGEMSPS
jgi:hypothetical protein